MKYRIYISSSETAEYVDVNIIESNEKNIETIVKAAALKAIYEYDLRIEEIEKITFNASTQATTNAPYMVIIQCSDFHIAVWAEEDKQLEILEIEDNLIKIAESIERNAEYESDSSDLEDLINRIYEE